MPVCAAIGCNNQSGWKDGQWVTLHRFPMKKPALLKQWLHNLGRADFTAKVTSRLCSEHFLEDCFEIHMVSKIMQTTPKRRRLKEGAVPTEFAHRKTSRVRKSTVERLEKAKRKRLIEGILNEDDESQSGVSMQKSHTALEKPGTSTAEDQTETSYAPIAQPIDISHRSSLIVEVLESEETPVFAEQTQRKVLTPMKFTCTYGTPERTQRDHGYALGASKKFKDCETQTVESSLRESEVHVEGHATEKEPPADQEPSSSSDEPTSAVPFDPDFQPLSDSSSPDEGDVQVQDECEMKKYVVFHSCLEELHSLCKDCGAPVVEKSSSTSGSMVTFKITCHNGHRYVWCSQPVINSQPLGNFMMAGAILTAGATFAKISEFAKIMNLQFFTKSVFNRIQRETLLPVIQETWLNERKKAVTELKKLKGGLTLAGDARCDSPGHSAKYGSYSLMHADGDGKHGSRKIVSLNLVQVSEVKNSNHMEVEGLRRCLHEVISDGVKVKVLATDRHLMVNSMLKQDFKKIDHQFDIWHMAKSIVKKLTLKARQKSCSDLSQWVQSISNHLWWCCATCKGDEQLLREKWLSLLQHITNRHRWTGNTKYHKCGHGPIPHKKTKWLKPNSPSFKAVQTIVADKRLLSSMAKLTKFCHTGELETFHSSLLKYCPKRQHFHYNAMYGRLMLAAISWNNSKREIKRDEAGNPVSDVVYSKRRKTYILRARYTYPVSAADRMRTVLKRFVEVLNTKSKLPAFKRPEGLATNVAKLDKPTKETLEEQFKSRFR